MKPHWLLCVLSNVKALLYKGSLCLVTTIMSVAFLELLQMLCQGALKETCVSASPFVSCQWSAVELKPGRRGGVLECLLGLKDC